MTDNSLVEGFLRDIPKAELHVHVEGTLEPDLMLQIAQRNGLTLPFKSVEEARRAYNFDNLKSFLDIYYQGAQVLRHEADFYELTWAYLTRVHAQNVRHVEIFFDPQTHTTRGVPFESVITGVQRALLDAQDQLGISSKLIMCFLRDRDTDEAMRTLQEALPFRAWITAIGLDSAEAGFPPKQFTRVFQKAREEGLLTVAHAGEEGPPEYIWQALNHLKVSRIDHGVRCIEDANLVDKLVAERVPLTVCPISNVKLRVFNNMQEHNLKRMLDLGLLVTVNSDDPAYFGGYVTENFMAVREALTLGKDDIYRLVQNSYEATFLASEAKQALMDQLENFVSEHRTVDFN